MRDSFFLNERNKLTEIKHKYDQIFNNNEFLEYDDVYNVTNKILPSKIMFKLKYILDVFNYIKYKNLYEELSLLISNAKYKIDEHNNMIFNESKKEFHNICGLVEDKELDDQQIDAIVRKNRNQLIIAGAGSGKTTTIVGKVKYLLLTGQCKPEDILLLSFTNASASEMKERVKYETNIDLDVMTFHKLGLEIIKKVMRKIIKYLIKIYIKL